MARYPLAGAPGNSFSTAGDTCLSRSAAGIVQVGSAAGNSAGTIKAEAFFTDTNCSSSVGARSYRCRHNNCDCSHNRGHYQFTDFRSGRFDIGHKAKRDMQYDSWAELCDYNAHGRYQLCDYGKRGPSDKPGVFELPKDERVYQQNASAIGRIVHANAVGHPGPAPSPNDHSE